MINYSTQQSLYLPLKAFFKTVKGVRQYKDFVPWCKDSFEMNKHTKLLNYDQIAGKYPTLIKNKKAAIRIKELLAQKENNQIKVKNFDGGITVGFNVLDFTYISNVVAIEPDIILSVTDSSNSHIFQRLESLWIMNENKEEQNINVEYSINFEFKSFMFSHVTNLFLDFLGDNIVKAFVDKTSKDMRNQEIDEDKLSDVDFTEVIDNKLKKFHFDSAQDKINLSLMLNKLYEMKTLELKEVELLLRVIKYNKNVLRRLLFLAEMAVWSNQRQVDKINEEIRKSIY